MKKTLTIIIAILCLNQLTSQTVYEHISNTNIYCFLDEMANKKIIELNDIVKPYSRVFIYEKLLEVKGRVGDLARGRLGEREKERKGEMVKG